LIQVSFSTSDVQKSKTEIMKIQIPKVAKTLKAVHKVRNEGNECSIAPT